MKSVRFLVLAVLCLMLYACKPSEKNYRAAYEAALEKQRKADEALGVDPSVVQRTGAPVRTEVDGVALLKETVTVSPVENLSASSGEGSVGVALARFSMPANARALAADLAPDFPGVFLARDGAGKWYVMLARCSGDSEAALLVSDFAARRPGFGHIGFPGAPVVVSVR